MKKFNFAFLATVLMVLGATSALAQRATSPRPAPSTPRPAITAAPPPVVVTQAQRQTSAPVPQAARSVAP